jgi:hypothetical protein
MPDEYVDSGCTQQVPQVYLCEVCQKPLQIGDWPFCPHPSTAAYHPFPAFEHDGIRFTDLQQIRRHERETMDRYRGGERVQPVVWRDFSNDRSNRDVNAFGRPNVPGKPTRSNIKLRRRDGE